MAALYTVRSSPFCAALLAILSILSLASAQAEDNLTTTSPQLKVTAQLGQTLALAQETTAEPIDLWDRIRSGFTMTNVSVERIQAQELWFATRPSYLTQAIERSRPYLFHIVEQVEKRGMPAEIALLPFVESAFDPRAESPQKASGIWQFIPSTGKVFGLKQNGWYDGRRDVLTATSAALDYLQTLHGMFGDWALALAAYNCGEGCVSRAIARNRARNQATDYASLDLPAETRNYVPKLLAVRNAIVAPERFGLTLARIPNDAFFMQVSLKHPMEARLAARLAEMPLDRFLALNPGFKRQVIYTEARSVLLIPADKIETFHFNLQRMDEDQARLQPYVAKRGETLEKIAARFDVTLQWLREHNPLSTHRGKLTTPQTLLVPVAANPKPARVSSKQASIQAEQSVRMHRIRQGDTYERIARLYNISLAELRRHNAPLADLIPGATLRIPSSSTGQG